MGIFKKMRAAFHDDWCSQCQTPMVEKARRLFAMPNMTVGHYVEHKDAAYYRKNLRVVGKKADIPPGMYACGAIQYRCPECAKRVTVLDPFLPVRDEEKHEGNVVFRDGELDDFLWQ